MRQEKRLHNLKANSSTYPVYFFESNTSGEKSFEEFYTDDEQLDVDSFSGLGVIKNTQSEISRRINENIF